MGNDDDLVKPAVWDPVLLPLAKVILGKKGLELRQAAEVDRQVIDLFRGKDFVEFIMKQEAVLKRRCQKALDEYLDGRVPADTEDCAKLGFALMEKGFITKCAYRPLVEDEDTSAERRKKKFWPDRVVRYESARFFDATQYYIVRYQGSHFWSHVLLVCMVIGVLAMCLFSVWPPWARVLAWYFALAILTLYFCTECVRMTLFSCGWILGCDFWFLPNLNDDYCTIAESFKPVYSFERRKDTLMLLVTRVTVFIIGWLAFEEASKTHSVEDIKAFVSDSFADIMTYGENYVLAIGQAPEKMALPNLADLEKEEEEAQQEEAQQAQKKKENEDGEETVDSDDVAEIQGIADEDQFEEEQKEL